MVGLLLINLGTPDAPTPKEVGAYLKEFLMDPYVIDIPYPLRWFLIHALIVPKRSQASSVLYQKIWTKTGSPLLKNTIDLRSKVQHILKDSWSVKISMRYGKPSIASAIEEFRKEGTDRILVFPLYPQYSLAATESSIHAVQKEARKAGIALDFMDPFFDSEAYLDSVANVSRPHLEERGYDSVLFSFHGLPERQIRKTDPSKSHCFSMDDCCHILTTTNKLCYRAQCFATARALAERLGLPKEKYLVCFQSRLGRTPWIKPYTDEYYRTLPKQGVKRLAVVCPSFVADCLETLEEVQIRGREEFLRHGGEELYLVPSLNADGQWAQAVADLVNQSFHHRSA